MKKLMPNHVRAQLEVLLALETILNAVGDGRIAALLTRIRLEKASRRCKAKRRAAGRPR